MSTVLTVRVGVTFRAVFAITQENGQPMDLRGFRARMQWRSDAESPFILADLRSGASADGQLLFLPEAGKLQMVLSAQQTGQMKPGKAVYDLLLTAPSGEVFLPVEGVIDIQPTVTRLWLS